MQVHGEDDSIPVKVFKDVEQFHPNIDERSVLNTDPVYLREVLVGLDNGTVNSDVSSLPCGVDSVFERWTSEWSSDAGHSIDTLRLYALLKSPLSPQGVSFLLNIATEHVTAAIQDNAHLFNQTTGVGHVLFHDRFRIFILATSSHHELKAIQNQLHTKLEDVLQTPEAHTEEIQDYSFRHFAEHGICSDALTSLKRIRCSRD